MPKVSVLSPTYQHAAFIGDCIRSVLAQTEQDWEMIIVDDCSDDGTADIAESFNDPRIVVIRQQEHQGVDGLGRSYAAAVARAKSPLLAILEGDDIWPPEKLEDEIPLFDDPDVVLAYGSAGLIDEYGCLYASYRHAPGERIARNDPVGTILPALIKLDFIVAVTVMVRRSALEEIGGFFQPSGVPFVDHPTWLLLASVGTFARSPRNLGFWRRHPSQVTTQSWFDASPNRASYLQVALANARGVVAKDVLKEMMGSIQRDPSRQLEEMMTARGRVALLEGRWSEATAIFARLLGRSGLRSRAVAAFGLVCAGCRTDMEAAIKAKGRHSLPSRRHSASHDQHLASHDQHLASHDKVNERYWAKRERT
jgi:hypothetical protein